MTHNTQVLSYITNNINGLKILEIKNDIIIFKTKKDLNFILKDFFDKIETIWVEEDLDNSISIKFLMFNKLSSVKIFSNSNT